MSPSLAIPSATRMRLGVFRLSPSSHARAKGESGTTYAGTQTAAGGFRLSHHHWFGEDSLGHFSTSG